jgi:hypothetical protein
MAAFNAATRWGVVAAGCLEGAHRLQVKVPQRPLEAHAVGAQAAAMRRGATLGKCPRVAAIYAAPFSADEFLAMWAGTLSQIEGIAKLSMVSSLLECPFWQTSNLSKSIVVCI